LETYDIVMIVVLAGATLFGAVKGFAWQLASITSIVLSYFVAYNFREPLSQSIQADPPWNRFLAMLILYIGSSLLIWVAFRMVSQTIDRFRLKEFDRQVGAMFGLAKGALYCTLITLFAVTLLGENIRETVVKSRSGRYIAQVLDRSESIIPEEIQEVVGPYLEKFDQRLKEGSGGGLTPWLNQVTKGAVPDSFWNESANSNSNAPAPLNNPLPTPWNNNAAPSSTYYPPTNFQAPSYPASQPYQQPVQQAERPWSSVYSSGGTR
jgi:membrane protein required for colicin V production